MKWRNMLALILSLSLILMLTIPIISANNIPLTQKEINKFGEDEFGLLSYDHFYDIFTYTKNPNDEYKTFEGEITVYNTYNISLKLQISKTLFSEERVHDTIKKDYIYYHIPNINWVTIPKSITLLPNHKYTFKYSINLPVEEAFKLSNNGGYIFLIIPYAENGNIQTAPGYKVFITLLEDDNNLISTNSQTGIDIPFPLIINIILLVFSSSLLFISFKNRKKIKKGFIYEKN